MEQNKVTRNIPLLDKNGNISEPGWSTELMWNYSRKDIKANKLRIKEWDYYLIYNSDFAIALTIADNGYMGLVSASFIDFININETTKSVMTFMPKGKFNLPTTSLMGDTCFANKKVEMQFLNDGKNRKLIFNYPNFRNKQAFSGEIDLFNKPKDSMAIATPFTKHKHFYYNQKIVGFKACGKVNIDGKQIDLTNNTCAILDWGRGVWTYKNTWYWGAGAGYINNEAFGFNIGYGFGDTTKASENILFYKGKAHKLSQIKFEIPQQNGKDDFMTPWKFTSDDNRFEMNFTPIINRHSNMDIGIIGSNQNQVFGKFTGTAILDDGTKIELKNFIGFAEKVMNKW